MREKLLFGLFLLINTIACSNNTSSIQEGEKQGFSLSTSFRDSTLVIQFQFDGIKRDFPKISINNQLIDTGYYPSCFTHEVPNFSSSSFSYVIEIDNDYLSDTIIIPSKIDSIFCNGVYLNDSIVTRIDSSAAYLFSWKSAPYSILYSIEMFSMMSDYISEIIYDTSIVLIPSRKIPNGAYPDGEIIIWGMSYPEIDLRSKPNKESDKLFIYYSGIMGPYKAANFTIMQASP